MNYLYIYIYIYIYNIKAEIIISLLYSYGYSKERFVWSLISAVGIFCLGSGATIVHGFQNLWTAQVLVQVKLYLATFLFQISNLLCYKFLVLAVALLNPLVNC
jgi:hypothetical protein